MIFFSEHLPPGKERRLVFEAVDEDDEDFDYGDEDRRTLCYFIVGGNQGGFFTIDPASRTLMVRYRQFFESTMHLRIFFGFVMLNYAGFF
jgi:hypothetical protein